MILAADPPAHSAGAAGEGTEVFACDFGDETDRNYDGWPDGWTRRRGKGYPDYVKTAIVDDGPRDGASGTGALRIDLDGGAAAIYSPPIAISKSFSYLLEATLRTQKLRHDVATCSITFLDSQSRPLASHYSAPLHDVPAWKPIKVGPVTPGDSAALAVVGLHLRPTGKADLEGAALFDDLRVMRLPRMSLELAGEHHLYSDPGKVEAVCRVSGVSRRDPHIHFELLDETGKRLAESERPLVLSEGQAQDEKPGQSQAGVATWNAPIPDWGFYRLRISLAGGEESPLVRSASLAVMRPLPKLRGGQFGWTLPRGERSQSLKSLAGLLGQVGINWVKFPVWYREGDHARADELAWFAERLGSQGIELVGVLDQPPAEVRDQFGARDQIPVASVFVEPALWQPVVDPVMSRLGLKVKWWQLGADDDTSYVGYPQLDKKVAEIRKHLERFGQEIQISIPWNLAYEPPTPKNLPWGALSHRADPAFTETELEEYLAGLRTPNVKRWVILEPLARSRYTLDARALDLVGRMLAAKMQRADGVFIPDPYDGEHGLLNADGTPAELLLPWRTTAHMISGADYLGSIDLPGGSRNQLFSRDGEAVLVVWNETPTRETLYLGEDVRQVDMWGRETLPVKVGHEQQIEVRAEPTFITGVNLVVARWRLDFAFDKRELASVFGRDQPAAFRFRNHFEQGIGGEISLVTPHVWEATPNKFFFKAAAGEELSQKFMVLLKPDANTGDQAVRVDFDVTADRNYKFSVYKNLRVGLGDVTLQLTTRLNDEGVLVVEQHLTNATDRPVSFNCYLFVPDRRRQRSQVFEQGRGRLSKTYLLPNGEELVEKTIWLRAEEINGPRILNCRVTVER